MFDFSVFAHADAWIALATLSLMEIVLGIDNIVFISIVTEELPESQRRLGRKIGLLLALVARLGLLFAISWIMGLTEPLFEVLDKAFSGRDLILGFGGLFLLAKATSEIFKEIEVPEEEHKQSRWGGFAGVMVQIMILDLVFSLDSVITAVGMADDLIVMVIAMIIAVGVMVIFADRIGNFVTEHRSMKVLALSFLILIGVMLTAEALGQHINKGYIYFAMAFALGVELVNLRIRRAQKIAAKAQPSAPG
jgi:predicted tellurium resistance membrane protein TerC